MRAPTPGGVVVLPLPLPSDHLLDDGKRRGGTKLVRPRCPAPPSDPGELAVHRWVLGHHLAFGVWRMLGDELEHAHRCGLASGATDRLAAWYDRYSGAQVYAGSCSAEQYATVIRPLMAACSPAFSGVWARDYERVANLAEHVTPMAGPVLKNAIKRNRLVHMALAKVLVPEGSSLLKQSGRRPWDGATDAECDLFDEFFLVQRRPVTKSEFLAHMLRRTAMAQRDLRIHPLTSERHQPVLDLLRSDLTGCLSQTATSLIIELELEERDGDRGQTTLHSSASR